MLPILTNARVHRSYSLGAYSAALLKDIKDIGPIHYVYVLVVVKNGEDNPCFYVTSEVNTMQREMAKVASRHVPELAGRLDEVDYDSPFLCTFTQNGLHSTIEQSPEWADIEKFTEKAISVARKALNIKEQPVEMSRHNTGSSSLWQQKRQIVLAILGLAMAGMVLFPPVEEHLTDYRRGTVMTGHAGYKLVFDIGTQNNSRRTETVNLSLLTVQLGVLVGIGAILLVMTRDKDR